MDNARLRTGLWSAAASGNEETVTSLLHEYRGASSAGGRRTPPALYAACELGQTGCVRVMLNSRRLDVNETGGNGATPLLVASYRGYASIVAMLLKAGARVDQANWAGTTPLMAAASRGNTRYSSSTHAKCTLRWLRVRSPSVGIDPVVTFVTHT